MLCEIGNLNGILYLFVTMIYKLLIKHTFYNNQGFIHKHKFLHKRKVYYNNLQGFYVHRTLKINYNIFNTLSKTNLNLPSYLYFLSIKINLANKYLNMNLINEKQKPHVLGK